MASHRIGARLAGASPEQLLAFIDEQAPLWSDAALRVAEEHAARLVEQPEWILSEVLLSPDLAPHILAQLPTKAHAAKGTCRAWRRGWTETLPKRGRDSDWRRCRRHVKVQAWRRSMASSMRTHTHTHFPPPTHLFLRETATKRSIRLGDAHQRHVCALQRDDALAAAFS